MQSEIIDLMKRLNARTGWKESTMSQMSGHRFAAERVRRGSASINTAANFKSWLETKLNELNSEAAQ